MPKPSGGGLSFVISGVVMSLFTGNFLPMICMPLAFLGFIDDLIGLTRFVRFFTQLKTTTSRWPENILSGPEFKMPTN